MIRLKRLGFEYDIIGYRCVEKKNLLNTTKVRLKEQCSYHK